MDLEKEDVLQKAASVQASPYHKQSVSSSAPPPGVRRKMLVSLQMASGGQ